MIDTRTQIQFYVSNTNNTFEASQFDKDQLPLLMTTTTHIYIGYHKPINTIYFNFNTPNTIANTINIQYNNGTTFVDAVNQSDNTKGFTRSGFITWDRNLVDVEKLSLWDSKSMYWYKLHFSVNHSATILSGCGLVFCDDYELSTEVPDINTSIYLQDKTSHILYHLASRNEIIQELRTKDQTVTDILGNKYDITPFDLLNINQVKQAAMYLCLSKIYQNFSDEGNDKFEIKSKYFYDKYRKSFDLIKLNVDINDNGVEDIIEKLPEVKILRIGR